MICHLRWCEKLLRDDLLAVGDAFGTRAFCQAIDLPESAAGDAFSAGELSWFDKNVWEGWFPAGKMILIHRKCLAGMIPCGEIDPDLWEKSHRDDFQLGNSSWFTGNAWRGCILGYGEHSYPKILKSEKTTCNSKTAMIQYDSLFERTGSHKTITSHGSELIFKKMKKVVDKKGITWYSIRVAAEEHEATTKTCQAGTHRKMWWKFSIK